MGQMYYIGLDVHKKKNTLFAWLSKRFSLYSSLCHLAKSRAPCRNASTRTSRSLTS